MTSDTSITKQAFRSLIQNVTNADSGPGPKSNLSPEAIERLTERLSEIVGVDAVSGFTPERNERGELVNEEGLPIIDITEPVPDLDVTKDDVALFDRDPIVRLSDVDAVTRERLRQQRERLLDMLEAEEANELALERQKESDHYAELARKRAEATGSEAERLKAAREMQKRMGKALIRNMAETKDKAEAEKQAQLLMDEEEESKRKAGLKNKKSVSFAPEVILEEKKQEDWGDVVPAKLEAIKRPTLLTEQSGSNIMKRNVVERVPGKPLRSPAPPIATTRDSDDESDDEQTLDGEDEPDQPSLSDVDSDMSDQELEEETDLDYATLQRQILLEYHKKRETMGQAAAQAMDELAAEPEEAPDVVTEDQVGLSFNEHAKPAISQFRAKKLASAYGASKPSNTPSTNSIGDFMVPASTAKTIQKSIRLGKVDADGHLIGGEDDSASETEDNTMQEVLDLLKKGEIYNLGPNGEYLHSVPPAATPSPLKPSNGAGPSTITETSSALRTDTKSLPPLVTKTQTSRFKASRATVNRVDSPSNQSRSATPVNHLTRSSPKSMTPPLTPVTMPASMPSMIVDSPSFAPPRPSASIPAPNPFSMIVDSPSFPMPGAAAGSTGPPARTSDRPDRPPTVMSTSVLERQSAQPAAQPLQPASTQPEKVSRFKRERM